MKTLLSITAAAAISIGSSWAQGPGEKAAEVARDTADTAKNVGHSVARGTRKAVNKVVDAVTPDPDARHVNVTLSDYKIDMPANLKPGKTAFIVKNIGKEKHNFEVRGNGGDHKFLIDLRRNETKVLHVQLKRGTYTVSCPVDGHQQMGMQAKLSVR